MPQNSHNLLFDFFFACDYIFCLLLYDITWSIWLRFDLLSIECPLNLVSVLAFDTVLLCFEKYVNVNIFAFLSLYSRTSMARTSLGPWKFVRDMGSSSQ